MKKVGHAGTLDPLATGLVLLCSGKYTKRLNELMGQKKTYEGMIVLGKTTPSYDLETEVEYSGDTSNLSEDQIIEASKTFIGEISQVPPLYSAIKVKGERAYKKARKKEDHKLEPRQINIELFEIDRIELPNVYFRLICSKGTYVRSLARDLGEKLNVGAYLGALRRTAIGNFAVSDAWKVHDFVERYEEVPR